MHPVAFQLGDVAIESYGLLLGLGFVAGYVLARVRAPAEGVHRHRLDAVSGWIVVSSLLGARLMHVAVEDWAHFRAHPEDILRLGQGGRAFYGGLLAAVAASMAYCRWAGIPFLRMADLITPSIVLGLVFARAGCYLTGCCFGLPSTAPWAVVFTDLRGLAPVGERLHPTQLYELLACALLFGGSWLGALRRSPSGTRFFVFLLSYSVARFALEYWRGDVRGDWGVVSAPQAISLGLASIAAVGLWRLRTATQALAGAMTPRVSG